MSPPRTRTQADQEPLTDEVARDRTERLRDDVAELRREIDEVDDRVLLEVREHRTASTAEHAATRASVASALADVTRRLDALAAARQGGQDGPAAPPPTSGSVLAPLAAVPPAVWGGVGTLLAALLLGAAAALGYAPQPKPAPSDVVVPARPTESRDGSESTP
jgi:hypothetical protein